LITDSYDVAPATLDTGSITNESGIKTLQTYLDAVVSKPSASGIKVYLDGADSHIAKGATTAADVETTSLVIGASSAVTAKLAVVNVEVSNAVAAASSVAAVRSFYMAHGATAVNLDALEGFDPTQPSAATTNADLWAAEFITDNAASYDAVGYTVTYVAAGAAAGARTASSTFDIVMTAAAANAIAYGDTITIGVGDTTVSVPISMTGTATTGSVTIANVAVGFDTDSSTTVGTAVYPHQSAWSRTGSGTGYVSSKTELITAIAAYLNQADQTTPDYKNATTPTGSVDKNRWTATASAASLTISVDGYMSKALTGAIVATHNDGSYSTEQTLSRYQGNTTTAATQVYNSGVIVRFAAKTAGADSEFTIAKSAGTWTLFDGFDDFDGADNKIYAPAASSGNNSSLYRQLDAASYTAASWTSTAATGTALPAANELNDDNLTASDYAQGINGGDATANTAADTDRTGWL